MILGRFIIQRLGIIVLLVVINSLFTFALTYLAPGDPATLVVASQTGNMPTPAQVQAMKEVLGLDAPLWQQYLRWLWEALHGNLGHSFQSGEAVRESLAFHLPVTLKLVAGAAVFCAVTALPLGIQAARARFWRRLAELYAGLSAAVPEFLVAFALMLLMVRWRVLPLYGMTGPASFVLPILTLGLVHAGFLARITQSSFNTVRAQPYMQAARARGLAERRVWLRHGGPNAALPVLNMAALQLVGLLSSTVVVETVFGLPGIGLWFTEAVKNHDLPVLQGCMLVFTSLFALGSLAADTLSLMLDPRLRKS